MERQSATYLQNHHLHFLASHTTSGDVTLNYNKANAKFELKLWKWEIEMSSWNPYYDYEQGEWEML